MSDTDLHQLRVWHAAFLKFTFMNAFKVLYGFDFSLYRCPPPLHPTRKRPHALNLKQKEAFMYKNIASMFVRQSTHTEINKLIPDPSYAGPELKETREEEESLLHKMSLA